MEATNRYTAHLYGCIHLLRSYVRFIRLSCLCGNRLTEGNKAVSDGVCQRISSVCWQGAQLVLTHTLHSPKRQTPGCRSRQFGSAPSWCWTRRPECPAGTAHAHTHRATWDVQQDLLHVGQLIGFHSTDLDHLLSINNFEVLQVFFQKLWSGSPLKQPQQAN